MATLVATVRASEIILERKPRLLSFAFGVHTCVGMYLARREIRIALQEFLTGIRNSGSPRTPMDDFICTGSSSRSICHCA